MVKIFKTTFLAAVVAVVLCAGTVSARQLRTQARLSVSAGLCSATVHCSGPCFCYIPDGTSGSCVSDPPGLKPAAK